ncbi:MAG: cupin domain-containing protein [Steroidobacteraceae bacterium]
MMKTMLINTRWLVLASLAVGVALGCLATQALHAQQSGIQRTILLRTDMLAASAPMEAVMGRAEIPAGGNAGRHTHYGREVGYVLSGEAVLEVDGEAPRILHAGDTFLIEAGKVHDARASGDAPARVLAFYLVEKGKPLAVLAAQ